MSILDIVRVASVVLFGGVILVALESDRQCCQLKTEKTEEALFNFTPNGSFNEIPSLSFIIKYHRTIKYFFSIYQKITTIGVRLLIFRLGNGIALINNSVEAIETSYISHAIWPCASQKNSQTVCPQPYRRLSYGSDLNLLTWFAKLCLTWKRVSFWISM